ncbi:MAG: valine--tRNA ligase [Cyanobacteria bacterium P01_C01_bin.89]
MVASLDSLPTKYDPKFAEAKWQEVWEATEAFKANPEAEGAPFCLVIPPPNVTGRLHMGHAFEEALIDTLVRYQRMAGKNTLWLPGTDHASIAVHAILDKQLEAEGTKREEIGREAFLERAWNWKAESGGAIAGQLRSLGVSADWSRERFTMDEGLSKAVLTAFTKLYDDGLIYRGKYMVNWCPKSQSAVADLEVENKEVDGKLWHFRYPLTDGTGFVDVATTRPETMLGDTAVAVNPSDPRYSGMVGAMVTLPIVGREIPIIADEYVDPEFGSGCVKITPAHDPNDFEMGKRHRLPQINLLNRDGTLNENGGEFAGLDRFVARKRVVAKLEELGCLMLVEDYRHSVPYSDRGKVPIEPLLSSQWFVKVRPLADKALAALDQRDEPVFVPERWTKVYRDWLVKLKDWCISRQLWWGHQIPAWYAVSETNGEIQDDTPFVVAMDEDEAREKAIAQFGADVVLERDPDVLDTWFSSGLWPFSTMGWPDTSAADFQRYYPTSTLITGFDIIFFWVARMTIMAGYFTDQMPFKTVYIHGLVRDENNKKMSKSANNGIDPLVLIDKYGTDATRYTLIREVAGAGQDIRLDYNRKTDESSSVESSRNFANKLWNASRFVLMNLEGQTPKQLGDPDSLKLELADRWILSRYNLAIAQTRDYLNKYGFGEAAKGLYEFIWGDFCDWYIELVKPRLNGDDATAKKTAQQVLAYVLDGILKLLHPFMPHVTEELWHGLHQEDKDTLLALQPYPESDPKVIDAGLGEQFTLIFGAVRTIRNLRAEAEIKPSAKVPIVLASETIEEQKILQSAEAYICNLAKVEQLEVRGPKVAIAPPPATKASGKSPSKSPSESTGGFEFDEDKQQTTVVLLATVFVVFLALKTVGAVLDVVDDFILLPQFFELVGFAWTVWFAANNLLFSEDRKALAENLKQVKEDAIGSWNPLKLAASAEPLQLPATGAVPLELPVDMPSAELEPEVASIDIDAERSMTGVVGTTQVLMPLDGVVDMAALREKVERKLGKLEKQVASLSGRLGNAKFVDNAPAEVVQAVRDELAEVETQGQLLRDRLEQLQ